MAKAPTIESLMKKGDGVLTKRAGVWTYPGCPNDRSGTNLVLPTEFVSDAMVQEAVAKGDLVPKSVDILGGTTAVVAKPEGDDVVRVVNMYHAGSVEAATELPLNSRPTHDAGRADDPVKEEKPPAPDAGKGPQPSGPIAAAGAPSLAASPTPNAPKKS